jgi:hypothetical protein
MEKDILARIEKGWEEETWHVVPSAFLHEWRKFIKFPGQHSAPACIDFTPLLCTHGLFLADSTPKDFFRDEFTAVYEEEWDALSEIYPSIGTQVSFCVRDRGIVCEPGVCDACWDVRVRDYTKGRIVVQRVETREACLLAIVKGEENEEVRIEDMNARGGRKRGRGGDKKRGEIPFEVVCSKTDSVKDLKVKVGVSLTRRYWKELVYHQSVKLCTSRPALN